MPEYADISKKFKLSSAEWVALQAFSDILKVCHYASACVDFCSDIFQIPHAFQQILFGEKTPTLGMSLAAFEVMAAKWKQHHDANPEFADVIDAGLDKLDEYYNYAQDVPANTIAMGKTGMKPFLQYADQQCSSAKPGHKASLVLYECTKQGRRCKASCSESGMSNYMVLILLSPCSSLPQLTPHY